MNVVQQIYFYIDDSGVLHKNEDFFIYAGYVFLNAEEKDIAYRKYKKLSDNIRDSLRLSGELKSAQLFPKHKRSLFNILKREHSLAAYVHNKNIYDNIMNNKKSRHRYKDYILKRAIKERVIKLIQLGYINDKEHVSLNIHIDEQLTASDGYYDLEGTIYEELVNGIYNFDYNTFHHPILLGGAKIKIKFLDSEDNYLIQASDGLANRLRASFVLDNPKLRRKPNHCDLHFPKVLVR